MITTAQGSTSRSVYNKRVSAVMLYYGVPIVDMWTVRVFCGRSVLVVYSLGIVNGVGPDPGHIWYTWIHTAQMGADAMLLCRITRNNG